MVAVRGNSAPFQTPPAPPADPGVTTRPPPAQATTTQPTSPLQPSSGTQQPLARQTQVKRTRKVPKLPATARSVHPSEEATRTLS
ncbi:hypothetical protein F441_22606 [Phytophthora nicotianae CJ01A1]|uniref:Uncharacterized protein n=3 Tax=Phytophthora nicotianae TaxID=4792 RepID=W2PTN7_PHYN3|nr:hypothetical protein PPTG_23759 [Phytophthora nicotianae INRA-310]ETK78373.1 hypothetical protein L915_15580 [Phytophthora nicotianae]ETL31801.1 hypothetical protein L916_15478 [Phytophthora nicotianae]ETN03609.1 hypothetical protein PPTG_23759 [Phytophthora nicotianae INRA-310]ETO99969.1 hypothetical protein F441_22606 [Phytophthora nicotianae CJ01A1]